MQTGAGGEDPGTDLMETSRPDGLGDIANLGLTLSEAKQLLANVQREIAAAQARDHVVRRPDCPRCDGVCHVKDYRDHVVATLFGQVTMKLPRFRCARCGGIETGISWPSHCRSTPELDRLRAHLSALMTYRVAADLLEQMLPMDAGTDPETLRRHTLRVGEVLVAGFLLCLLRAHERLVGDVELPLRRVDFVTLRAERPHFFILWACDYGAPAPFYIASRDGSMLAEVA
jgi:hypothetical protein